MAPGHYECPGAIGWNAIHIGLLVRFLCKEELSASMKYDLADYYFCMEAKWQRINQMVTISA